MWQFKNVTLNLFPTHIINGNFKDDKRFNGGHQEQLEKILATIKFDYIQKILKLHLECTN
jgi:hypothetical protein